MSDIIFAQSAKPNTDNLFIIGIVSNLRNLAVEILKQTDVLQQDSHRQIHFKLTGRLNPGDDPQIEKAKT